MVGPLFLNSFLRKVSFKTLGAGDTDIHPGEVINFFHCVRTENSATISALYKFAGNTSKYKKKYLKHFEATIFVHRKVFLKALG
jgi:hypothetical protein